MAGKLDRLNILVGYECSGVLRNLLLERGHFAVSADLKPAEDADFDQMHYHGDVWDLIHEPWRMLPGGERDCGQWDMLIAHPDCTYPCASGLHWDRRRPGRAKLTTQALDNIEALWNCGIPKIALENPQGCINTRLAFMPRPQYVQPWQFGDDASKRTGWWLQNLPPLKIDPAQRVPGRWVTYNGKRVERWSNQTGSGQNRLAPSATRAADRARSYAGVMRAVADQWAGDARSG